MKEAIGIVGLGLIGTSLAKRLMNAGFEVHGYDIAAGRCANLAKLGGKPAPSLASLSETCRTILIAVLNTEQVESVVEGPRDSLPLRARDTIVCTSTCDPQDGARRLHPAREDRAIAQGFSADARDRSALRAVAAARERVPRADRGLYPSRASTWARTSWRSRCDFQKAMSRCLPDPASASKSMKRGCVLSPCGVDLRPA
jgi:hypothetical protein